MSSYLRPQFTKFIDKNLIKVVCEIGSRDAYDAIALDRAYQPDAVHIFEPNPRAIEMCRRHIDAHKDATGRIIHLAEIALSDFQGQANFHPVVQSWQSDLVPTDNYGASSMLLASGRYGETMVQDTIEVKVERMDDYAKQNNINNISLVCMDVQGVELSVLRGFGALLYGVHYLITEGTIVNQYEGQDQFHDINRYLVERNFDLVSVDMDGYWGYGNFLYVNRAMGPIPLISG